MSANGSARIVLDGEKEYNDAIRRINANIRLLNAEMANLDERYKDNKNSTEALQAKQDNLNKKIAVQKERIAALNKVYAEAQEKLGENNTRTLSFAKSLKQAETDLMRLEGELKEVNTQLAKVGVRDYAEEFKQGGSHLESFGRKLNAISTVSTAAAAALGGLVVKAAQTADDINTLSKITSVSTEDLQKFAYASDLVDVSLETYSSSLKKLTKNMQNAQNGTQLQVDAFNAIGVSWEDAEGRLRNANDVFYDIIDALGRVENETERDAYAMNLFGKSATELNPLISAGADELRRLGQEAKDAGVIMDQETLDSLNEFNDKIDILKAKLAGRLAAGGAGFVEELTPILENVIKVLDKLMSKFNGMTDAQQQWAVKALIFFATISKTTTAMGALSSGIGTAITAGTKFVQAMKAGEGVMAAFNLACNANPIGAVVTVIGLAVAVLGSFKIATALAGDSMSELGDKIEETTQKTEALIDAYDSETERINANVQEQNAKLEIVEKLIPRLEELAKKTNRTTAEETEYRDIVDHINELMPSLNLAIDDNTGKLNQNTQAIRDNIAQLKEQIQMQAIRDKAVADEKKKLELEDQRAEAYRQELEAQNEYDEYNSKIHFSPVDFGYWKRLNALNDAKANTQKIEDELKKVNDSIAANERRVEKAYTDSVNAAAKSQAAASAYTGAKVKDISELSDAVKDGIDSWEYMYEAGEISYSEYLNTLTRIRDQYFTKDSKGWREYNLKIINLQKSNQSTAIKSAESEQKSLEQQQREREQALKEAQQEELSILKWRYDMGEISEADYYASLGKYRDKYFAEGTEEWRNYTLQIKQYADQEQKKLFEKQQESSFKWIDEREFLQDWAKFETTVGDSFDRIRARSKAAYEQGLIDFEEYCDSLDDIQSREEAAFDARQQFSDEWRSDREFYNDWDKFNTNNADSIKREINALEEAYKAGEISYKKYYERRKALDKEYYSALKDMQEDAYSDTEAAVDKVLERMKASIDKQTQALNDEVSALQKKFTTENRNKELSELKAEADLYRNAGTNAGQEHYKELVDQIEQLNQEAELEALQEKNNEIIQNLEAQYAEMERQKAEILTQLQEKQAELIDALPNKLDSIIEALGKIDIGGMVEKAVKSEVNNSNVTNYVNNNNSAVYNNNINDSVDFRAVFGDMLKKL